MPCHLRIACLLILASTFSHSQVSRTTSDSEPVVTFTIDFPASQPEHYSIRIPSTGPARYQSSVRLADDSGQIENFSLDFALGPETRQKIFELAAKAGYFQKNLESSHKGLAFTGKKTLSYKDGQRTGEATFNYSANAGVEELTALMQNLSTTLEFGHRLQYDQHYQKLALDEELKRMEEMARDKQLIEVTAIEPILDQIIADQSVINVTRARAQRLLERSGAH